MPAEERFHSAIHVEHIGLSSDAVPLACVAHILHLLPSSLSHPLHKLIAVSSRYSWVITAMDE
jgi:hypothetical protein